jgi:hypothetical protein
LSSPAGSGNTVTSSDIVTTIEIQIYILIQFQNE